MNPDQSQGSSLILEHGLSKYISMRELPTIVNGGKRLNGDHISNYQCYHHDQLI